MRLEGYSQEATVIFINVGCWLGATWSRTEQKQVCAQERVAESLKVVQRTSMAASELEMVTYEAQWTLAQCTWVF